ncbi:MAG: 16S rRNA (guanine(966)-N(2))-methyltransferase RsmD [Bacillota bacterium]|nr:16S rRNA (guanine(966)-N(2))-methyltransferase RsmD [Bacillota bacterium]
MRVIAGEAGGLGLEAPRGLATRPTSARLKESLFAMLESRGLVQEARVLDVFAGSGQLAIEALSRGARAAVLVESARPALAVIRRNLAHCRLETRAKVLARPAARALGELAAAGCVFDLIFMDPPYETAAAELAKLAGLPSRLLADGGLLIVESARGTELPGLPGLLPVRDCQQGGQMLSFYERAGVFGASMADASDG